MQRVDRIRRGYRIEPNGFQPRLAPDGTPEVVVSVLVANLGRETLDHVTLRVHLQGADGRDRASALAPLHTARLVPGVSAQLTAVARPLAVGGGESVLVELEDAPDVAGLAGYPEYAGTAGPR